MERISTCGHRKPRRDVFILDGASTATKVHLTAEGAPRSCAPAFAAVACAFTTAEAAASVADLASRYPGDDVALVCPPAVIRALASAAAGAGSRRLVLPAAVSSTVLRVGQGSSSRLVSPPA